MSELDRLNKYLAHAGVGSRRQCDDLIRAGRITLDGIVVETLATKVAPGQTVAIDGKPIGQQEVVYWLVNKPKGYICTNHDPSGRPRAIDLVDHVPQRVYTVGRLDEESEGLLLLTNDGDLAHKLTHPSYGVEKTYEVQVAGQPTQEDLDKLVEGVWLSDGKARASHVKVIKSQGDSMWVKVILSEGKNREIRRMLAKIGHKVLDLKRVAIGPIWLDRLPKGKSRRLKPHEIEQLKEGADNARKSFYRGGPEVDEAAPPDAEGEQAETGHAPVRPQARGPRRDFGPGRGAGPDSEFAPRPRGRSAGGEARGGFGERRGPGARSGGARPGFGRDEGFGRDGDSGDFRGGPRGRSGGMTSGGGRVASGERPFRGEGRFGPGGPGDGPRPPAGRGRFGGIETRGRGERGPGSRGPGAGGPGGRGPGARGPGDRPGFGRGGEGFGEDRARLGKGPGAGRRPGPGMRSGPGGPPRSGEGDRPYRGKGRPSSGRPGERDDRPARSGPAKGAPLAREIGKIQRKGGKPAFRRGLKKDEKSEGNE